MNTEERYPSYDLAGAKITPTTIDDLNAILKEHIDEGRQCIIASQNMHGLHVRLRDPWFASLHQLPQAYVHIDGMPLVLLCRLAGIQASQTQRVTLVDWIWPLLAYAANERWRIYYVGSTDSVLEKAAAVVAERIPGLKLRMHNGYFDSSDGSIENAAVVADIQAFRPHVLLVGMGMGRQERWILSNLTSLAPISVCTVGACMEYVGGAVRTPPRWMGRCGLEWLFRLAENPARFWYRYFLEPWPVLFHFARNVYRSARTA
jgi:N-acetylglucosaminyldiphosphoundecaprenol N-acetyl-beta-D-mannosaminyltransferase